jgi:hypothetical protein
LINSTTGNFLQLSNSGSLSATYLVNEGSFSFRIYRIVHDIDLEKASMK